jgi:hypothetical protein
MPLPRLASDIGSASHKRKKFVNFNPIHVWGPPSRGIWNEGAGASQGRGKKCSGSPLSLPGGGLGRTHGAF